MLPARTILSSVMFSAFGTSCRTWPGNKIISSDFGYTLNYGLNADQAFWMIVIMDIWHWTPFVTLTLLAGLSALPQDPYESAKIDGANNFQIFLHIHKIYLF